MRGSSGHYYVTVVEDLDQGRIVASATLSVEYKFIRECAKVGGGWECAMVGGGRERGRRVLVY